MEMTGGTPRKGYGMNEQGARPAATAGVMTAAAVVYALAAIYLPMLTMVLGLLWPVFVALVVVRVGLKWGVLMTAASLLLLMLFATPVMGAFFVLAFAPTGLVLGALVRRDRSAVQTLFAGAAASLGGKVMIDAADMTAALDRTIEIYRSLGIAETEITELRAAGEQMLTLFVQMLPALLIVSALAEAALSLTILQRVLRRMGIASRALPSFTMWRFPVFFPYLFGFAIVGLYWGSTRDMTLLYEAALNAYLISFFAGLIQGLSLMHFMMMRFEVAPFVRTLLYVFVAINGLVTQVVSWTGLFDMVYDYRKKLGIDKKNIQ